MCYDAKTSLITWFIIIVIVIMMWYRNTGLDRMLAPFLFAIGLIQLIEYGVHSKLDPQQAGKLIYLTLWLQVLLLAIGLYGYLQKTSTFIWMIAALFVFVLALSTSYGTSFRVGMENGHLSWSQEGGKGILGSWNWVYLLGIIIPFIIVLAYKGWSSISVYLLLIYGFASALIVAAIYPSMNFPSMWCYTALGFVFLSYLIGAFGCA